MKAKLILTIAVAVALALVPEVAKPQGGAVVSNQNTQQIALLPWYANQTNTQFTVGTYLTSLAFEGANNVGRKRKQQHRDQNTGEALALGGKRNEWHSLKILSWPSVKGQTRSSAIEVCPPDFWPIVPHHKLDHNGCYFC